MRITKNTNYIVSRIIKRFIGEYYEILVNNEQNKKSKINIDYILTINNRLRILNIR